MSHSCSHQSSKKFKESSLILVFSFILSISAIEICQLHLRNISPLRVAHRGSRQGLELDRGGGTLGSKTYSSVSWASASESAYVKQRGQYHGALCRNNVNTYNVLGMKPQWSRCAIKVNSTSRSTIFSPLDYWNHWPRLRFPAFIFTHLWSTQLPKWTFKNINQIKSRASTNRSNRFPATKEIESPWRG